jgi:hypothetical protein
VEKFHRLRDLLTTVRDMANPGSIGRKIVVAREKMRNLEGKLGMEGLPLRSTEP